MRVLIQRVKSASVKTKIDSEILENSIDYGMLVLLGIEENDSSYDIDYVIKKISKLRIFNDENHTMNLSILDIKGEILVISQFTLHALTKKGNRPSYIKAAKPEIAIPLYKEFIDKLTKDTELVIKTGWFGADMDVNLINHGPVTIMIDSKEN